MSSTSNINRLVGLGLLVALVIILQGFASGVKIGTFSPPLALIPITIGAILYGEIAGLLLGIVFGIVVIIAVISGAEPFSTIMFNFNPIATVLLCLIKGGAAGFFSGFFYKILRPKVGDTSSIIVSSMLTPFFNTGIFSIGMLTIFYTLIKNKAGDINPVLFFFTVFIGFSFLLNIAFIGILTPVFIRIIKLIRK